MSGPNIALSTGANAPFGKEDTVRVTITWKHAPAELDVSCFMVGADGKVSSDDYFIFTINPLTRTAMYGYSVQMTEPLSLL